MAPTALSSWPQLSCLGQVCLVPPETALGSIKGAGLRACCELKAYSLKTNTAGYERSWG